MSGSNFFPRKEGHFLPISFDPAVTKANSPLQIRMVERTGASILVATPKDGCFSFKEYTVGADRETSIRFLLPLKGFTGLPEGDPRTYEREFKIDPGTKYNYVVLDRYFVGSLPKYKREGLKFVPLDTSGKVMEPNIVAPSLEFRLVPSNNHYFGAQQDVVIVAGSVVFNDKNQVISIDNESGGYHVQFPEEIRNKEALNKTPEIDSQRAALGTFGITNFEPYVEPEKKPEVTESAEETQSSKPGKQSPSSRFTSS